MEPGHIIMAVMLLCVLALSASRHIVFRSSAADVLREEPIYSRELPFEDSLCCTFAALYYLGKTRGNGSILGAILLEWVLEDHASLEQDGQALAIRLPAENYWFGVEGTLFDILQSAAGPDGILQEREFRRWSLKHPGQVRAWMNAYVERGLALMHTRGWVDYDRNSVINGMRVGGKPLGTPYQLTPAGAEELRRALGFAEYLKDFTILDERAPKEVALWRRYLVYGQLFGTADEVARQFRDLYPTVWQDVPTADLLLSPGAQMLLHGVGDVWINFMSRLHRKTRR